MRLTVPVTPDAETARAWAEAELAKSAYHRGDTLADRVGAWISDFISRLFEKTGGAAFPPIGYLLGAVILLAVLFLAARVVAPAVRQRGRSDGADLLDDDTRTAAQIKDAARKARSQGDLTLAALEFYRATVRGCEERVVIDERAGRTAREAARDIARSVGSHRAELLTAASTFDELCYGHRDGTQHDVEAMESLERTMSTAKALKMALA